MMETKIRTRRICRNDVVSRRNAYKYLFRRDRGFIFVPERAADAPEVTFDGFVRRMRMTSSETGPPAHARSNKKQF